MSATQASGLSCSTCFQSEELGWARWEERLRRWRRPTRTWVRTARLSSCMEAHVERVLRPGWAGQEERVGDWAPGTEGQQEEETPA